MESYVCVLSTNSYLKGLLTLNNNLKEINSNMPLLCLINETINNTTIDIIKDYNINYKIVKSISGRYIDEYNPQWYHSFDKINVFNLLEYEKIVYLDLDLLILNNIDNLFNYEHISMVRDLPFSDKFNSGVMVISPNKKDYENMMNLVENSNVEYKGDQDVINEYFDSNINELPQEYNCMRAIFYKENEIFDNKLMKKVNKHEVCIFSEVDNPTIIRYIGELKPFMLKSEFDDSYCKKYFSYLENIDME